MGEKATRSPLKAKPLRYPGQSLDEEIERVIDEDLVPYVFLITMAVTFAAMEWLRWWTDAPYRPLLYTILAVGAVLYSAFRIRQRRQALDALKLGRDGEKIVGQYLDDLRKEGHRIFHDIVADDFNIDHVIISTRGIYAVETKTFSKPARGKASVRVEGSTLLVDGREPDRNPIEQAQALATWLRTTLQESTGKTFPVRSVVLFPGWFVEGRPADKQVWVLNPKALPGFLQYEEEHLRESDAQLAAYHLSRYIRTH